jgi:hypothetical protein
MAAAVINHLPEQRIQADCVRCCMCGWNYLLSNMILYRTQQAASISEISKKLEEQRCDGCFAVRSSYTNKI